MKPKEPEKVEVEKSQEVIEYKAPEPIKPSLLERPPFDAPLVKLKYSISSSLQQEMDKVSTNSEKNSVSINNVRSSEIAVGTSCTNGGCREVILN